MRRFPVVNMAIAAVTFSMCGPEGGTGIGPLPVEETLHVGDSIQLPGGGPVITFDLVSQDSRCPIGAMCVWEGDGAVKLTVLQMGMSAKDCTVHTTLNPKSIAVGDLDIALKDLVPYPRTGTDIDPSKYEITLAVDSKHE